MIETATHINLYYYYSTMLFLNTVCSQYCLREIVFETGKLGKTYSSHLVLDLSISGIE